MTIAIWLVSSAFLVLIGLYIGTHSLCRRLKERLEDIERGYPFPPIAPESMHRITTKDGSWLLSQLCKLQKEVRENRLNAANEYEALLGRINDIPKQLDSVEMKYLYYREFVDKRIKALAEYLKIEYVDEPAKSKWVKKK